MTRVFELPSPGYESLANTADTLSEGFIVQFARIFSLTFHKALVFSGGATKRVQNFFRLKAFEIDG